VTTQQEAGKLVFRGEAAALRGLWERADNLLMSRGLQRDVKTIYVSYTDSAMKVVAAAQPSSDAVEIALAIPPSLRHRLLVDAIHLKWRTLPKAVQVRQDWRDEWVEFESLVDLAIKSASSIAPRPTDDFTRFRQSRRRRE
jgi:hypothetical protein